MEWKEDHSITAVHSLHEILIPEEAEILASYTGTWYKKAAEAGHDRARKAVERMEKLV